MQGSPPTAAAARMPEVRNMASMDSILCLPDCIFTVFLQNNREAHDICTLPVRVIVSGICRYHLQRTFVPPWQHEDTR